MFTPTGERTSRLHPRASRADNTSDHLDSDEAMDENIQINAAAHNQRNLQMNISTSKQNFLYQQAYKPQVFIVAPVHTYGQVMVHSIV